MVSSKTNKLVKCAILAALVVVLQVIAYALPSTTFNISLVLIPIVIGAVMYGPGSGAILGAIFGIVVTIASAAGFDKGGFIVWTANPALTALTCIVKGSAAGFVSGLVYKLLSKHETLAAACAAIVCPIVNTGLFCCAMLLFFRETLEAWAAGTDILYYIVFGLVGVNFLIELAVNVVLAPAITRIIKAVKKR